MLASLLGTALILVGGGSLPYLRIVSELYRGGVRSDCSCVCGWF